ncbi:MAG: phospholipase D-like domain-containing protein [Rubrivivax sp.]
MGVEGGSPQTGIFERHLAREEAITDSPLTTGNQVLLLQDGPATYQAMLAANLEARDHIQMETYILDDDDVGRRIADALIAKQRQSLSGFLCARHSMSTRSMYAKQEDDEGGLGRSGGDAVDPQGTH